MRATTRSANKRSPQGKTQWCGRIAQLVEQLTLNQRVPGSSPGAPTKLFRHLAAIAAQQTGLILQVILQFCSRFELQHRSFGELNVSSQREDENRSSLLRLGADKFAKNARVGMKDENRFERNFPTSERV